MLGILQKHPVHRFPSGRSYGLDILLQSGVAGILPPVQPGKSPEGGRILQMKGQLLIGQLPILFQNGAAQHLFGTQPQPSGISLPESDKVLINQSQYLPIVIQNRGDRFQFLVYFIPGHHVIQFPLHVSWTPHVSTPSTYLYLRDQYVNGDMI